ncbi:hypothetical protein AB0C59_21535 [Streptomyces sp. NPDC048664]|uniref:hypothetical protein n=1 Tax=Streptomyces sp. NPDC048664 TaxID=3154505 RepID=UPI0034302D97
MRLATSSPERQGDDVLAAAKSVGGHIVGWTDDRLAPLGHDCPGSCPWYRWPTWRRVGYRR